jgi:hypothetical protein
MMKLSQERLEKYVHLALTDDKAPATIYAECGEDATSLLSVVDHILYNLDRVNFHKEFSQRDKVDAVKNLLRDRCWFLNRRFTWTDENRKRFLSINDALMNSCDKAWDEALAAAAALEERIRQNDPFLKDYEIDVSLDAYPSLGCEDEFDDVLAYFGESQPSIMSISHSHYEIDKNVDSQLAVDKIKNWNSEYFGDAFRNDYICYATHRLLDTQIWSFDDIISVSSIWADVVVSHQNYIDLEAI